MLVDADGDEVAGGGGEAAGGTGGAEVHCTSTPAVAMAAAVQSRLNAPTGAESMLRDVIRKTAVMGGFAGSDQSDPRYSRDADRPL